MSFVAAATSVGTWAGFTSATGALIGGSAIIGAGVGGAYSALTGDGNILDSMLTGAALGGLGGWGLSAAGAGAGTVGTGGGGTGIAGGTGVAGGAGGTGAASQSPALFAYDSTGAMVPANYDAAITGATNMPGAESAFVGPPKSAMINQGLSAKEMLGYGLGATTLMGLLGGNQEGSAVASDKGNIRPYEYTTSKREPEAGKPYYFEPIQYDKYGKATAPIDTSERNYFNQKFTPLPTYKAALGGQVPNLTNMPAGGLAAIEGMREGYGPAQTMAGNIPQFSNGGQMPSNKMLEQMQQMKFERDMPDEMRDFMRAKRMGLMEGTMFGDEQARAMGQKPQDFMFAPQVSQDGKNMNALATINKQLTDDTEMKLMALGYKTPEKSGIAKYGAGITQKLGKDSDLSGYFEQSPDRSDKAYGVKYSKRFNMGGMAEGDLGGYSDGGRLLRGPGDGVSDDIPATINNKQPARLADGEFVIPARIVSEIGNGSTDAGAKRLYAMMDKIQSGRKKTVGKGKVAVDTKAKKHLLA